MSQIDGKRRKSSGSALTGLVLVLLLSALGLTACGESSSTTSTSANAASTAAAGGATGPGRTSTGATGAGGARFQAVRTCLQKHGITLPRQPPRGGPSGPGGFAGAGAAGLPLPNGVTRAQLQAAIKKCGGGAVLQRRGARLSSPVYRAALVKFAACMRENGVNLPAPNTSGSGPIFSTKGLNTTSAQFQSAELKCHSYLAGARRHGAPSGATGAAGTTAPGGPAAG